MPLTLLCFVKCKEQSKINVQDFGEIKKQIQRNCAVIVAIFNFTQGTLADMGFFSKVILFHPLHRAVIHYFGPNLPKDRITFQFQGHTSTFNIIPQFAVIGWNIHARLKWFSSEINMFFANSLKTDVLLPLQEQRALIF